MTRGTISSADGSLRFNNDQPPKFNGRATIATVTSTASAMGYIDTITTRDGNDLVIGGGGSDVIDTGAGMDGVIGDDGTITISGGDAWLLTSVSVGDDRITDGNDGIAVIGGGGSDIISSTGTTLNVIIGDDGVIQTQTPSTLINAHSMAPTTACVTNIIVQHIKV